MEEPTLKTSKRSLTEKIKDTLLLHAVDSTAALSPTPLFSVFEIYLAGMSDENSIHSRLLAAGLTFLGMGSMYTKGLDASRKIFNILSDTKEKFKYIHDASYSIAFNLIVSPPVYYAAGVRDIKQIAVGTGIAMGFGLVAGGPVGYAVDTFRDLTGLKETERLPRLVKNQKPKIKKGLAALLVAGVIALTAGIYSTHSEEQHTQPPAPQQALYSPEENR